MPHISLEIDETMLRKLDRAARIENLTVSHDHSRTICCVPTYSEPRVCSSASWRSMRITS